MNVNLIRKSGILIVDDNPQNLQLLGSVLEKNGFEVTLAVNGREALDFVSQEKPDLILLDVMMPEIDGFEVCKTLKEDQNNRGIPVIFLTAKTEMEDILQGFAVGGVDYVTKPFNSEELLARVKTHVALKRAREEIKTLKGMVPICASCKQIRDDKGYWNQVESYIEQQTDALFTHTICPKCAVKLYPDLKSSKKMENKG